MRGSKSRGGKPSSVRQVIGFHAVREVFKVRPDAVRTLMVTAQSKTQPEVRRWVEMAKARGFKVEERLKEQLDRLGSGHQGLCVEVEGGPELDWSELKGSEPQVLVALDEIEDPHNLGAVLRSAWLLGAKGLIVPEMRAAHLTPTVFKIASGAGEHVPVSIEKNLPETLSNLKEIGFWIYGLSGDSELNLFQTDLNEKVCWVIGSESSGLRSTVAKACDELVAIPQVDLDASLNASVAAGIALAESHRQHSKLQ